VAGTINLKLLVAGVVFSVLAAAPSLASAQEEGQSDGNSFRVHLVKTLNLRPDEARLITRVEEKYDRIRQEAVERINKSAEQIDKLLSGEKPDEAKLKELTTAMAADQDILVNTYKGRRDESLATLSPVQQGKYLLVSWKWQQKLLEKYGKKPKAGKQEEGKKAKAP
jgi:Spy/CpxP family protein refolding chaperone